MPQLCECEHALGEVSSVASSYLTPLLTALICAVLAVASPKASAIVVGQVDTFEDNTAQLWFAGGGPLGQTPPVPPVNQPSGGPLGLDDNYLQISSTGGSGPGSRLIAMNGSQWSGDYTAAGITAISMNLRNFGTTDLAVRLYLENPIAAAPTDTAMSDAVLLLAGGGWTHAEFALDTQSLTVLQGDADALLANVVFLRIVHATDPVFPPPAIAGLLGVDDITALGSATAIPEPATLALFGIGLAGLGFSRKRTPDRSRSHHQYPRTRRMV